MARCLLYCAGMGAAIAGAGMGMMRMFERPAISHQESDDLRPLSSTSNSGDEFVVERDIPEKLNKIVTGYGQVEGGVKQVLDTTKSLINDVDDFSDFFAGLVFCGGKYGGCHFGTTCVKDVPHIPEGADGWCIATGSMICMLGGHLPWMPLSCRTVIAHNSVCVLDQCRCGHGSDVGDCEHMVQTVSGCTQPCIGCSSLVTCPTGNGAVTKSNSTTAKPVETAKELEITI
jgi:hypothetical protein